LTFRKLKSRIGVDLRLTHAGAAAGFLPAALMALVYAW
jgi:hypothetical protein